MLVCLGTGTESSAGLPGEWVAGVARAKTYLWIGSCWGACGCTWHLAVRIGMLAPSSPLGQGRFVDLRGRNQRRMYGCDDGHTQPAARLGPYSIVLAMPTLHQHTPHTTMLLPTHLTLCNPAPPLLQDDDCILDRLAQLLQRPPDEHLLSLAKCTGCQQCGHEGGRRSRIKRHTAQNPCPRCPPSQVGWGGPCMFAAGAAMRSAFCRAICRAKAHLGVCDSQQKKARHWQRPPGSSQHPCNT